MLFPEGWLDQTDEHRGTFSAKLHDMIWIDEIYIMLEIRKNRKIKHEVSPTHDKTEFIARRHLSCWNLTVRYPFRIFTNCTIYPKFVNVTHAGEWKKPLKIEVLMFKTQNSPIHHISSWYSRSSENLIFKTLHKIELGY